MILVREIQSNKAKIIESSRFKPLRHVEITDEIPTLQEAKAYVDYCLFRDILSNMILTKGGFSNLDDEDKKIVLKYTKCVSSEEAVGYLMSNGKTLEEASLEYVERRSKDIREASKCYSERLHSSKFTAVLISTLGQEQSETLLETCRDLFNDLSNTAILGTNYGNNRAGIMDWLEGTDIYAGSGLQGFAFDNGISYGETLKQLKDILYYGYTTE